MKIKTTFLAAITTLVSLVGYTPQIFADARLEISTTVQIELAARERLLNLSRDRRWGLLEVSALASNASSTRSEYTNLQNLLVPIRQHLEMAVTTDGFTPSLDAAYIETLVRYYELQQELRQARTVLRSVLGTGVINEEILSRRVQVPTLLARRFNENILETFRIRPDSRVFDDARLMITPVSGNANMSYVEPTHWLRLRLMARSLLIFPSEALSRDQMKLSGLKTLFLENAVLNSFLYGGRNAQENEKVRPIAPTGFDADSRLALSLYQEEAENIINERIFRDQIARYVAPVLASSAPYYQEAFAANFATFVQQLVTRYQTHIDPSKVRNVNYQTDSSDYVNGMRQAADVLDGVRSEIRLGLVRSPNYYYSMRDDVLRDELIEVLSRAQAPAIERFLACFYFRAVQGIPDVCGNRNAAPQFFSERNGWQQNETVQLRQEILAFLQNLHRMPQFVLTPPVFAAVDRVRENLKEVGVSKRRYQYAETLITASRALMGLSEQRQYVQQARIVPARYLPGSDIDIKPGHVLIAKDRSMPVDNSTEDSWFLVPNRTYNTAAWIGEIVESFAATAGHAQATTEIRRRLQDILNNMPEELSSKARVLFWSMIADLPRNSQHQALSSSPISFIDRLLGPIQPLMSEMGGLMAFLRGHPLDGSNEPVYPIVRNAAMQALSAEHARRMNEGRYQGAPWDTRLALLRESVSVEHARNFIDAASYLMNIADVVRSGSLRAQVEHVLQRVLESADVIAPLKFVMRDVLNFQRFLNQNRVLIQSVFLEPEQRYAFLRQALTDPAVFVQYLDLQVQDLYQRIPALFYKVWPHSSVMQQARLNAQNSNGIELYKVIYGLTTHALSPARQGAIVGALNRVASDSVVAEILAHPEQLESNVVRDKMNEQALSLNLNQLMVGAIPSIDSLTSQTTQANSNTSFGASVLNYLTGIVDQVYTRERTATTAQTHDDWWPQSLKVRDFIAALRDQRSTPEQKIQKVLVSAILGPYYRAAIHENENATRNLMSPNTEWVRALNSSPALRNMALELGGIMPNGIQQIIQRELYWYHFWQTMAAHAAQLSHFMTTVIFPSAALGSMDKRQANLFTGAMVVGTLPDIISHWVLTRQYLHHTRIMAPYARSGMAAILNRDGQHTSTALVDSAILELEYNNFRSNMAAFLNRLPMDVMWIGGVALQAGGWAWNRYAGPVFERVVNRVRDWRLDQAEARIAGDIRSGRSVEQVLNQARQDYESLGIQWGANTQEINTGRVRRISALQEDPNLTEEQVRTRSRALGDAAVRLHQLNRVMAENFQSAGQINTRLQRLLQLFGVRPGSSWNAIQEYIAAYRRGLPQNDPYLQRAVDNLEAELRGLMHPENTAQITPRSPDWADSEFAQAFERLGIQQDASASDIRAAYDHVRSRGAAPEQQLRHDRDLALQYNRYRNAFENNQVQPGADPASALQSLGRRYQQASGRNARSIQQDWDLVMDYYRNSPLARQMRAPDWTVEGPVQEAFQFFGIQPTASAEYIRSRILFVRQQIDVDIDAQLAQEAAQTADRVRVSTPASDRAHAAERTRRINARRDQIMGYSQRIFDYMDSVSRSAPELSLHVRAPQWATFVRSTPPTPSGTNPQHP